MKTTEAPKTSIESLQFGERFVFHPGDAPSTFMGTANGAYRWIGPDGTDNTLQAPYYTGTGKTAWPFVYPLQTPPVPMA